MQALILAAGMGKRLKDLTKNNTKCMIKVNGVTLIERMLNQIEKYSFNKIVIVIGYEGKKLKDYIETLRIQTPIEYVINPIYDKTNNIYSLSLASDYLLKDDTILFESDLIFEDSVISSLISDPRSNLALVDKYESWMDGTCVLLSNDDSIESFVPGKKVDFTKTTDYYKTVNIYKFSKDFSCNYYVPFLMAYQKALGKNEYYEQVLRVITILENSPIKAKKIEGKKWYEIDDIQDLDIAESIFNPNKDEKLVAIQSRYGGYWRYPKLLDFCFLVNPYFPTLRLKNEIRANFDQLLTQYPSGMQVNCLLASKNFDVSQESVVVGNGAAELIKILLENYLCKSKKVGVIRPTFEEYPNRLSQDILVEFVSNKEDFQYSVDDIISYFEDKNIGSLVLINPDNPSGNYIPKKDVMKLIDWAKDRSIKVVVDESFVDFANEENSSLIDKKYLAKNTHVFIIKSISKSYGVPGLRLGILVSYDTEVIANMKKSVPIWNLNSFAEFFMQIEEKYNSDYKYALELFKKERSRFFLELSKFPQLKVIPSQANYFMVKLDSKYDPKSLSKALLDRHDILIKNLSSKTKCQSYLRLAIRSKVDNDKLLSALRDELI